MKKLGFILGIIAGIIIILSGILTALKLTPPIALQGLEVALGIWRIFAGSVILVFVFLSKKISFEKLMYIGIIILGLFEIFVFYFEKDYSILMSGAFIAVLAGIFGLLESKKK
mgnify:CR=1 FL=1